jgi:hypothetical protein
MIPQLITAPTYEPVTLAEAKDHLRLEHDTDDSFVLGLIATARQHLEKVLWRAFLSQTWELTLEGFPGTGLRWSDLGFRGSALYPFPSRSRFLQKDWDAIELPLGEVQSVTSVTYVDVAGVTQTLATSEYQLDTSLPAKLRLPYGKTWPDARSQWDAVKIRYVVGWANPSKVPAPLKAAIKLLVSQMYEHRTPEVDRAMTAIAFSVDALTAPFSLSRLG